MHSEEEDGHKRKQCGESGTASHNFEKCYYFKGEK